MCAPLAAVHVCVCVCVFVCVWSLPLSAGYLFVCVYVLCT